MADPTKGDLDAVFNAPQGGPPPPPMDEAEPVDNPDEEQSEQALDDSIDEMFATDDPAQRREAFKRAMKLCMDSSY
jgi:hypothetical protein